MRLLNRASITSFFALWHVLGIRGSTLDNHQHQKDEIYKDGELHNRAPSPVFVVPLQRATGHLTWTGTLSAAQVFPRPYSDAEMKKVAEDTYNTAITRVPWEFSSNFLVSVIGIPGRGFAAGTVWQGDTVWFGSGWASVSAPHFWAAVPGANQALLPNMGVTSTWHAEAVAAVVAEVSFGAAIAGGRWPAGTKIATYGGLQRAGKNSCSNGATSVWISCTDWLERLGISPVAW